MPLGCKNSVSGWGVVMKLGGRGIVQGEEAGNDMEGKRGRGLEIDSGWTFMRMNTFNLINFFPFIYK